MSQPLVYYFGGTGGGVAYAAKAAGCLGIIIDGAATDIQELREYGLPVWARGLSTVTGKRQFTYGEFCVPISCGGVAVERTQTALALPRIIRGLRDLGYDIVPLPPRAP